MNEHDTSLSICETSTIKELLLSHPEALRVMVERGVPVSCADGTIADAARACGLAPATLIRDLVAAALKKVADHGQEGRPVEDKLD